MDHNCLGSDGCLAIALAVVHLHKLRTLFLRNFEKQNPVDSGCKAAIRLMLPQVNCPHFFDILEILNLPVGASVHSECVQRTLFSNFSFNKTVLQVKEGLEDRYGF